MTLLDTYANLDCPLFTVLQNERQLNTESFWKKNSSGTLGYKLLEIKSPSSRKGENLIDKHNRYSSLPYLEIQNESVYLKRSHPYFTRIQVSILVTNVTECDLVIQSLVDLV